MTDDEIRTDAYNKALYAEGTRAIFERRAKRIRILIRLRDFVGLAVPIVIAFVFTSENLHLSPTAKNIVLLILGVLALLQGLIVAWSLLSQWDESLAYDIRASRDSYELDRSWTELAQASGPRLQTLNTFLNERQKIQDSHDAEQGVSLRERASGYRAGLIAKNRLCSSCGAKPTSYRMPVWASKKCVVCGGN